MTVERKYALTKIAAGDYLLPSDDQSKLWRITVGTDDIEGREVDVWQVWLWRGGPYRQGDMVGAMALAQDIEDWGEWDLHESWCKTRQEAIDAAMRMGGAQ